MGSQIRGGRKLYYYCSKWVVRAYPGSLDPSISVEDYQKLNAVEGSSDSDSDDSSSSDGGDNIETSTEQQGSLLGDNFKRRGAAHIEKTILNSMDTIRR